MGTVLEILPYIFYPTLVLVSAAIGIYLLIANGEDLTDRYQSIVYSLTKEQSEGFEGERGRRIILSSRAAGCVALLFSLLMAVVTYFKFVQN